jgi:hypothetical protein
MIPRQHYGSLGEREVDTTNVFELKDTMEQEAPQAALDVQTIDGQAFVRNVFETTRDPTTKSFLGSGTLKTWSSIPSQHVAKPGARN